MIKQVLYPILVVLLVLFFNISSFSQYTYKPVEVDDIAGSMENIIKFTTPTSAYSFNNSKEGVDLYSGRATFQIPIYTLKSKSLEIPVSLSYISGGVPVEKQSDWVGMDWTLQAGGYIVRQVKGIPDETPKTGYWVYGSVKAPLVYDDFGQSDNHYKNISLKDKKSLVENSSKNDLEPDVFFYCFGGYSGKFYIKNGYDFVFIPYQPFSISKYLDLSNRITGFVITTPDGSNYQFGYNSDAIEYTLISTITYSWSSIYSSLKEKKLTNDYFTTKWHLSRVNSVNNDIIELKYSNEVQVNYVEAPRTTKTAYPGQKIPNTNQYKRWFKYLWLENHQGALEESGYEHLPMVSSLGPVYNVSQTRYQKKVRYIKSIINNNGDHIDFAPTPNRADQPGDLSLDLISVYDRNNTPIKSFKLEYNVVTSENLDPSGVKTDPFATAEAMVFRNVDFGWTSSENIPANVAYVFSELIPQKDILKNYTIEGLQPYNYKRNFLSKVTESGSSEKLPSYIFEYINPEKLPRKTSVFVDTWGYGIESTTVSTITGKDNKSLQAVIGVPWDKVRNNPENVSRYGLLRKITIPAGGSVEYFYENNPNFIGCRVQQLKKSNNSDISFQSFSYNGCNPTPPLFTYKTFYFYHEMLNSSDDQLKIGVDYINKSICYVFPVDRTCSFSIKPVSYTNGSPIGYSQVTVKSTNSEGQSLGDVSYEFENTQDIHQGNYFVFGQPSTNQWESFHCNAGGSSYYKRLKESTSLAGKQDPENDLYNEYIDQSHKRGQCKKQTIRNSGGNPVKEITYGYKFGVQPETSLAEIYGLKTNYLYHWQAIDYNWLQLLFVIDQCTLSGKDKYKYLVDCYLLKPELQYLEYVSEKTYDLNNPNNFIEKRVDYKYNNSNGLVTEQTTKQSDGSINRVEYKYPQDLDITPSYDPFTRPNKKVKDPICEGYYEMKEKNIYQPYEILEWRNNQLVRGSLTVFNVYSKKKTFEYANNMKVFPKMIYEINAKTPIANYTPSWVNWNQSLGYQTFNFDTRYTPKTVFDKYDEDKSNLLQSHRANDIPISYIWNNDKTLPIAEVKNAKYDEIYFNSFELGSDPSVPPYLAPSGLISTDSHTGKSCIMIDSKTNQYAMAKVFNKSVLTSGKYVFSAWIRTSGSAALVVKDADDQDPYLRVDTYSTYGQWKYYEKVVDINSAAFNGCSQVEIEIFTSKLITVLVDDVRFRPLNSQMTTYTYNPLIGISSVTDNNNRTTYYEYDDLGRLKTTKDEDGFILNSYKYKYALQDDSKSGAPKSPSETIKKFVLNTSSSGSNNFEFLVTDTSSTNFGYKYIWNFGDNSTATDTVCYSSHQFPVSSFNTYPVNVEIFKGSELLETLSTSCECFGNCNLTVASNGNKNFTFAIDGSGFEGSKYAYEWDFGDDVILNNQNSSNDHTYRVPGIFNVKVDVKSNGVVLKTLVTSVEASDRNIISVTKIGNGTISPTGNSEVTYGDSITYTFTSDSGYQIKDVVVNGSSVGADSTYTFNNVITNQNLSVEFETTSRYLEVNTENLNFDIGGGVVTFSISSNDSWSIIIEGMTTPESWISVNSSTGSNNAAISVTCGALSDLNDSRIARIIITSTEGITRSIEVAQGSSGLETE